jgi:hypothetical protein
MSPDRESCEWILVHLSHKCHNKFRSQNSAKSLKIDNRKITRQRQYVTNCNEVWDLVIMYYVTHGSLPENNKSKLHKIEVEITIWCGPSVFSRFVDGFPSSVSSATLRRACPRSCNRENARMKRGSNLAELWLGSICHVQSKIAYYSCKLHQQGKLETWTYYSNLSKPAWIFSEVGGAFSTFRAWIHFQNNDPSNRVVILNTSTSIDSLHIFVLHARDVS